MIVVPPRLAEYHLKYAHESGPDWTAALPGLVADFVSAWDLRLDGEPMHGVVSLVVPVLQADGTRAMLKLQPATDENITEAPGLRAWDGDGIVRLLKSDTVPSGVRFEADVLLLEALEGGRSLEHHPDVHEALEILSTLLARLVAHQAPEGLRRLADIAGAMLEETDRVIGQVDAETRWLLDRCAGAVRELIGEPGDRLLHWDLHFDNVLAASREPWLAIDPKPLAGDPGFELLPALRNRYNGPDEALKRFDLMTSVAGLDRARAAGWTLGRVLQDTLWDIADGEPTPDEEGLAIVRVLARRQ
ncbi:aminoglycoside phosphotransferase family protein [Nonomuraea soli]|uniref:Streptomycin 6-kinase n=1 Tax=Nonomuraea soli TaxID=1032476 RepID=A0A7W0HQV0_9ACTN|nr:aminoglycoside phosphotransferase family protein [Nonomuraea soli]MBA2891956.1 streptomycin 6-kinase [Nonomuraea soli]